VVRGQVQFVGRPVVTCEVPSTKRFERVELPPSRCPPLEPCGIHGPFGQATDANGCSVCGCKPNPMEVFSLVESDHGHVRCRLSARTNASQSFWNVSTDPPSTSSSAVAPVPSTALSACARWTKRINRPRSWSQ
jgi:hypothetical protein